MPIYKLILSLFLSVACVVPCYGSDLSLFEQRKEDLRRLGVPNREEVLTYLTLELFYNVPRRPILAKSIEDVSVRKSSLHVPDNEIVDLIRLFPDWKAIRNTEHPAVNVIQISGHHSFFAWDPEQPEIYFISKPGLSTRAVNFAADLFHDFDVVRENYTFDYAPEVVIGAETIRKLETKYSQSGDLFMPFHGFMGSPLLAKVAADQGKEELDYIEQVLMPQFADLYFTMAYLIGLWPDSHTQNLWLVVKPDGTTHFATKDFGSLLYHSFFSLFPRQPDKSILLSANRPLASPDTASWTEPSFHFAEFPFQSIALAKKYKFNDQARMMKAFFVQLISRLNERFALQIRFPSELQFVFDNLEKYTGDYDLLQFSVDSGHGFHDRRQGAFAFAEHLIREINKQLYNRIIGSRFYPRSKADQKVLAKVFANAGGENRASWFVPLEASELIPDHASELSKVKAVQSKAVHGLYNRFRSLKVAYQKWGAHYEYSGNHLLLVSRKGEVLAALPYKARWLSASLSEKPCQQMLSGK